VLDGLRGRAAALAAVANIATAFIGGLALADRTGPGENLGSLEWSAIGLFFVCLGLSVFVLAPTPRWISWHQPQVLLALYLDPEAPVPLSEFRRALAYYNGEHYAHNARGIGWLILIMWLATISLAAEVALWLIVVAT
jgi:hypothetical protein